MKSSALCRRPLTKKRWNREHLLSVLWIPLHCEGKAFPWELSKYHSSASRCKDSSMVEGVCVCARVCVCVRSCACACVCLSLLGRGLREYEQTTITVTFHGVLEALRQPLHALRESQLRQAGAAIRLGFVKCKIRSIKCPRSQSCCCHLGLSRGPASWPGVDSPASHGGTERGLPLSRLLQKPTLSDARSQKGPTGFCALVCD